MDEQFAAIFHTMTKDGLIDQIFAVFTDEEKFVAWGEDFINKNPRVNLYFTVVPFNPEPGTLTKSAPVKVNLEAPKTNVWAQAAAELEALMGTSRGPIITARQK